MPIGYAAYFDKTAKKVKESWCLDISENLDTFKLAADYALLTDRLRADKNLPPKWTKNDEEIIWGIVDHIKPFYLGGEQLDPIRDQMMKWFKAVKKINEHLTNEKFLIQDFYNQLGYDAPHYQMNSYEVKKHMDEKRKIKREMYMETHTLNLWHIK